MSPRVCLISASTFLTSSLELLWRNSVSRSMTGTATSSIRKFCIWSAVYILLIVSNRLACRSAST